MEALIIKIKIQEEQDIVRARQRSRKIADLIGFSLQDSTKIATAVSEIARNSYTYADSAEIKISLNDSYPNSLLVIKINDQGPGINNIEKVLQGNYNSQKGLGLGIIGSKRIMDHFEIDSQPGEGTHVVMGQILPHDMQEFDKSDVKKITDQLTSYKPHATLDEVRAQNIELLNLLSELRKEQKKLRDINKELEDTNRGMVALHRELEEKNRRLKEASRLKSKFLANMSHELRTPLNSIIGFTGIILQGAAGEINEEQKKQLNMVYNSGKNLLNLINDILDISKIEANKITINPGEFNLEELIKEEVQMFLPMVKEKDLAIEMDISDQINLTINNDRSRIKQVLTNLLSNAVKFTEEGNITVTCNAAEDNRYIKIGVQDTGIGIPEDEHELIFDEFERVNDTVEEKPSGTGLGLSISRKLARMMGGDLRVKSHYREGSTFYLTLPVTISEKSGNGFDPNKMGLDLKMKLL